jgi:pre-mRNA-splicing helicase BRR2
VSRQLLVIARDFEIVTFFVKLEFSLPVGTPNLKLYVICDSYVGADHDIGLYPIQAAEGEDGDSDENMDSGDDE